MPKGKTKALAKGEAVKLGAGEKLGPRYKKKVPCSLDGDERAVKSDRIVEALGETKVEKGLMKEATSGHRKIINELVKEVENLREQLAAGTEMREVYVAERKNYREDLVEVYRLDTMEMVESRPLTKEERQDAFPIVARARRGKKAEPAAEGGEEKEAEVPAGDDDEGEET